MERENEDLSIRRQCELLALNRSSLYYEGVGLSEEMDKICLDFPTYGSRRMSRELRRRGCRVGRLRVRSLMRLLGVEAIYPYLLREVDIDRPNIVWAADITYIRLKHGLVNSTWHLHDESLGVYDTPFETYYQLPASMAC
ncbi:MAG: IS3 family transposase [Acidobacteriota bacterium]|nr:IS3 family transposase [Acidobacteriota bacterium]